MKIKLHIFAAVLTGLTIAACSYAQSRLLEGQELKVVAFKWETGLELLDFRKNFNIELSEKDVAEIKSLGLTGELTFSSSGTYGRASHVRIVKHARVLVVMKHQLTEPVDLPQPDGVEVIYIQGDDKWHKYPSDAPTLKRVIHLEADKKAPQWATLYMVEHVDGSRQGGTLFTW